MDGAADHEGDEEELERRLPEQDQAGDHRSREGEAGHDVGVQRVRPEEGPVEDPRDSPEHEAKSSHGRFGGLECLPAPFASPSTSSSGVSIRRLGALAQCRLGACRPASPPRQHLGAAGGAARTARQPGLRDRRQSGRPQRRAGRDRDRDDLPLRRRRDDLDGGGPRPRPGRRHDPVQPLQGRPRLRGDPRRRPLEERRQRRHLGPGRRASRALPSAASASPSR